MILLGSTGSIGVNALEICRRFKLPVKALVAGNNLKLLQEQIDEFHPDMVAIADHERMGEIKHPRVMAGEKGILELLEECHSELVVNALVGFAGLQPTIKSIELGKRLALANKESLVIAGAFLDCSRIFPIDSEHFGLWYLMNDRPFRRLVITASGGAFRDWEIDRIRHASYSDALKHPNWSMGDKITIDSASMANKLFELLEARWLFETMEVDAVIERQSIVHAFVEFMDGSTTAHLAGVDMKLPISYALGCRPEKPVLPPIDLLDIGHLSFEPIDENRYPLWQLREHLLKHPRLGVVLNAANETAIERFRLGKCDFSGMYQSILDSYSHFEDGEPSDLSEVFEIDREVRKYTRMQAKIPRGEYHG
jgi:1-deoxy-D-xylulose-5-phosphate reductoisomerase